MKPMEKTVLASEWVDGFLSKEVIGLRKKAAGGLASAFQRQRTQCGRSMKVLSGAMLGFNGPG